jgi:L-alanine-DL-glutamate epimerase-like enolase superfamily enzyme
MEPILFENGSAKVPQGPGLGIEIDGAAIEIYKTNQILETRL